MNRRTEAMDTQASEIGEKWLRLLKGYAPIAKNDCMITEKIEAYSKRLKTDSIHFEHPLEKDFLAQFFTEKDGIRTRCPVSNLRNVILTGMAGDGKSALCYALLKKLFPDAKPDERSYYEQTLEWNNEEKVTFKFIVDFSVFFSQEEEGFPEHIKNALSEFTESIFTPNTPKVIYVIAINDGLFAELWKKVDKGKYGVLERLVTNLYVNRERCSKENNARLTFFNLSLIPTRDLFEKVYDAIMDRKEWSSLFDSGLPQYDKNSQIFKNYQALKSDEYKRRLFEIMALCDLSKRHIPIRELLMWLANGLLGILNSDERVAGINDIRKLYESGNTYDSIVHRNLLGDNLSPRTRDKYAIFRFFDSLKLGNETLNDLDDLLIFGHLENTDVYNHIVRKDPYSQRDPGLDMKLKLYTEDNDVDSLIDNDTVCFPIGDLLALERQRIFFNCTDSEIKKYFSTQSIWTITVFHSAKEYLAFYLDRNQNSLPTDLLEKIILGLNRVWTGLLAEDRDKLYLAKGLGLSSAPISDIFVWKCDIEDPEIDTPNIEIVKEKNERGLLTIPALLIHTHSMKKPFRIELTMERFEFLIRVSEGVMPNSFSHECLEDFTNIKASFLQYVGQFKKSSRISTIETGSNGKLLVKSLTQKGAY